MVGGGFCGRWGEEIEERLTIEKIHKGNFCSDFPLEIKLKESSRGSVVDGGNSLKGFRM